MADAAKRGLCFLLATVMLLLLCACGDEKENAQSWVSSEESAVETVDEVLTGDTADEAQYDTDEYESDTDTEFFSDTETEAETDTDTDTNSDTEEVSSAYESEASGSEDEGTTTVITYYTAADNGSTQTDTSGGTTAADLSNETAEEDETYVSEYSDPYAETDESTWVDASWFDDAVLVGDSITLKLSYYCAANPEALSSAQFVCAASLGYVNSQWELNKTGNVHPYYNGVKILTETCAAVTGASKVIIGLGMNDIGVYGVSGALSYAQSLVEKIRTNSPDVEIYIESVTPIYYYCQKTGLNNELVREFNSLLAENVESWDCKFIDTYSALSDTNGNLPYAYCSDPSYQGIHFTDAACAVWVECLKSSVGAYEEQAAQEAQQDEQEAQQDEQEEQQDEQEEQQETTESESQQEQEEPAE